MSVKGAVASGCQAGDGMLARVPVMTLSEYLQSAGRAFVSSTGRLSLSLAGNVRITLENPSADRAICVSKISGLSTGTAWATVLRNPTSGLPGTIRPHLNSIISMPGGAAVLRCDISAATPLGGGTDTGVVFGIPSNNRFSISLDPGIVVPPGEMVGINVPFTGAADAALTVYWGEPDA